MATIMLHRTPKAATRVNSPKISPNPPRNSAAIARNANTAGMCRTPVTGESVTAKPPEHLLGAMREENYAEHQPENRCCSVVIRCRQFANHKILSGRAAYPQFDITR